ncbi:MAG: hypothetical protein RL329_2076 [Bacteroidota bacterium]
MSAIQKMRTSLQKYLRETPKKILQQQFDELNQVEWEGISAQAYCALFEQQNLQTHTIEWADTLFSTAVQPIWHFPTEKIVIQMVYSTVHNASIQQIFNNLDRYPCVA